MICVRGRARSETQSQSLGSHHTTVTLTLTPSAHKGTRSLGPARYPPPPPRRPYRPDWASFVMRCSRFFQHAKSLTDGHRRSCLFASCNPQPC